MRSNRSFLLVLGVGFVVALGLRLWHLDQPPQIVSDEVSFVVDAQHYLRGETYFDPHPPLGKMQIAVAISLFGDRPWVWRAVNAVAGASLVPLIGWLAWRLTRRRRAGVFAVGLLVLDGLLLSDSRLGMINVPYLLYAFAAWAALLRALDSKRPTPWLVGAGLLIGAALSVKWLAGIIVVPALALYFWPTLFGQSRRRPVTAWITALALLVVPIVVYTATFVAHFAWLGQPMDFGGIHRSMFTYHLSVPPTGDPYAQPWWGWLPMWQPFLYWSQSTGDALRVIWSLPNPWLWWTGCLVFAAGLLRAWRQLVPRVLLIGLLLAWLPFAFIQRVMYSYHALPFDLLLILLLAVMLDGWWERHRRFVIAYGLIAAAVFLWFLPWYLNIPLSANGHQWRQWLPGWQVGGSSLR